MDPLVLCPSCHRHVKSADAACPFCRSTRHKAAVVAGAVALSLAFVGMACSAYGNAPPESEQGGGGAATDAGADAAN
jgi:hypothetical protein